MKRTVQLLIVAFVGVVVLGGGVTAYALSSPSQQQSRFGGQGEAPFATPSTLPVNPTVAPSASSVEVTARCQRAPKGSLAPSNARVVPVGSFAGGALPGPGNVWWFGPGVHRLTAPISVSDGATIGGAPGAVLDGGWSGPFSAFSGNANQVRILGLTVTHFGSQGSPVRDVAVVNRSAADEWTIEDVNVVDNSGVGVFLGSRSTVSDSCFRGNGQNGIVVPKRGDNDFDILNETVAVTESAVVDNGGDINQGLGCSGCTSGVKAWAVTNFRFERNYVAGNHEHGLWCDTNCADVVITQNLFEGNDGAGVAYETSYNATISNNHFVANGFRKGTGSFPMAALFIANSGGRANVPGPPAIDVSANSFLENRNPLTVFDDVNRFCGSRNDTSVGSCTRTGGSIERCARDAQSSSFEVFQSLCRWGSTSITVDGNHFGSVVEGCQDGCNRISLITTEFSGVLEFRHASSAQKNWTTEQFGAAMVSSTGFGNNWVDSMTLVTPFESRNVSGTM